MEQKYLDIADNILNRNRVGSEMPSSRRNSLRHDIAAAIANPPNSVTETITIREETVKEIDEAMDEAVNDSPVNLTW